MNPAGSAPLSVRRSNMDQRTLQVFVVQLVQVGLDDLVGIHKDYLGPGVGSPDQPQSLLVLCQQASNTLPRSMPAAGQLGLELDPAVGPVHHCNCGCCLAVFALTGYVGAAHDRQKAWCCTVPWGTPGPCMRSLPPFSAAFPVYTPKRKVSLAGFTGVPRLQPAH